MQMQVSIPPRNGEGDREAVGGVRITSSTAQHEAITDPRAPPRHRFRTGKFAGKLLAPIEIAHIVDFVGRTPPTA